MSDQAMTAATAFELAKEESRAEEAVRIYMYAYLAFPTSDNFDLTIQRMRAYQSAWMNGRNRP